MQSPEQVKRLDRTFAEHNVKIHINCEQRDIGSIKELSPLLDVMESESTLDIWLKVESGPALNILRQGRHSFMMYLRGEGDPGFITRGATKAAGMVPFTLANGQVDKYAASWCVPMEECLRAIAYFCVNNGEPYPHVQWHKD